MGREFWLRHRTGPSKQFSLRPLGQRGPRVRRALRSIGMRHEAADIVALGQPCMSSKKSRGSLTRAGQAALQADGRGTLSSRKEKKKKQAIRSGQQLIGRIKDTAEGKLLLVVELSRGLGLSVSFCFAEPVVLANRRRGLSIRFFTATTLLIRRTSD